MRSEKLLTELDKKKKKEVAGLLDSTREASLLHAYRHVEHVHCAIC
jgi:hypothetical protein